MGDSDVRTADDGTLTGGPAVAADRRYARLPLPAFVPDVLATPTRPFLTLVVAWLVTILGSLMLSAIVQAVMPDGAPPDFSELQEFGPGFVIFSLVVFAPVIETLIMGTVLLLLGLFLRPGYAIIISALGWGIAHSVQATIWGLVIWWPFVIFSTLFVVWRQRSLWLAFLMPALVHMMQNSLPALTVAFPDLFSGLA